MAALKSKDKVYGVYIDSLLTKKVILSITEIGKNIKENLQRKLSDSMEGKCIEEGFIRPGSIRIESYSCGLVNTENIEFQTVFTCKICHPVEGMLIECTSKTITKAGIHAQVLDRDIVPVTVFVARDHHNMDRYFQSIQENTKILVKVIGIRYELNDPYICVLAKLLKDDAETTAAPQKIKIKKQPINIGGDVLDTASEEDHDEE
jgi:DNA-directed RNA polymerase subunit E'/Rpb7